MKHANTRRFNKQEGHPASSSLILGCWNVQYFRSAQLYFKSLIECFDIFPISEQFLHEEQLDFLKSGTDHHAYNCIVVSSFDNPPLL